MTSDLRREDGAVVVVAALLMTSLLLFGALAVDLGAMYLARQAVVGDVDAAARAAAVAFGDVVTQSGTCSSDPSSPAHAAADQAAQAIAAGNGDRSVLEVTVTCDVAQLTVTVTGTQATTGFFTSSANREVSAISTARYVPAAGGTFLPIAVCRHGKTVDDWLAGAANPNGEVRAAMGHDDGECGDALTNFGWLRPPGQLLADALRDGLPGNAVVTAEPPSCDLTGHGVEDRCPGGPELAEMDVDALFTTLLDEHQCIPAGGSTAHCATKTLLVIDEQHGNDDATRLRPAGFLDVVILDALPGAEEEDDPVLQLSFRAYRPATGMPAIAPGRSYLCSVDVGPESTDRCQD